MTISPWMFYLGASAFVGGFSRIWVLYRRDRKARRAFRAQLFDTTMLDNALSGVGGDDRDVLLELRETFAHLNREAFADELWALDRQLCAYYERIPKASRPTMRQALISLIASEDRWLSLIAAKASARIGFVEADAALSARIEVAAHVRSNAAADSNYCDGLRSALDLLRTSHSSA